MDMGGGGGGGGNNGMIMSPPPSSSSSTPNMNMNMHDNGTMPMNGMSMMHMTFFWGHKVNILFSGWPGDRHGIGMYVLALFLVFAVSVLVEFPSYNATPPRLSRGGPTTTSSGKALVFTVVSAVRTGLSYLVMLAVMSFNIGVLLVAILGHAVGFFVFGSGVFLRRQQANEEADQQTLPNKS